MADLPHASSIDIPTESSVVSRESSSEDSSHSIKRDVGDMPRGFIFTTAADKRDLEIYFIHAPLKKSFDAEIRVLEKFAAIWARGELSSASKERFQGKIVKRHLRKAMRNNLESYRDAQKPSETKVRCDDGGKPSSEA
ncbi:hypothetical protein E4U10_004695 [Claviceps purpurea]|nr:hypothetical protein E4U10_004695 [Claviceps purpurea]